jgi:mannose-6-phosphate isomerase-like protein (cupin superfamily)
MWKTVKQDHRYIVKDNTMLETLVVSTTLLNPSCKTTGHKHKGQEEVYIFNEGEGLIEIDEKKFSVKKGDIVLIQDGAFHRVHNNSKKNTLGFVCVFNGSRLIESG